MKTGMLWFDNDPKSDLSAKINKALLYYQHKYGQRPNLCFIHPSMLNNQNPSQQALEVRVTRKVLPNHLWIGVNDNQAPA